MWVSPDRLGRAQRDAGDVVRRQGDALHPETVEVKDGGEEDQDRPRADLGPQGAFAESSQADGGSPAAGWAPQSSCYKSSWYKQKVHGTKEKHGIKKVHGI